MPDDSSRPPLPPSLDPRRGPGAESNDGKRSRRRALPAAVRVIGALLSVALLAGSGWGWYLGQVAEASVSRSDALPSEGNVDVNGGKHAGSEMNLLLVGRDSRAGLTKQQRDELSAGDQQGLLDTDTMILVHIPADGSAASFVSLPRDMYVAIPGHGKGKLNSAYADGYNAVSGSDAQKDAAGQRLMIQTISQFTGLQIDHFAAVDLLGFLNLSTIVGGVQVNLCEAVNDADSGAHFPAGVQTISGADALRFVRQRHGLPRNDLDREVRQQVYIAGLIRNVVSSNLLLDPGKQREIVAQVGSSITVDEGLKLFDLAAQMQSVRPGAISFQSVPGLTDGREDGWGLVLEPPAQSVLTSFFASLSASPAAAASAPAAPTAGAPAPASVRVSVLNGSGIAGAAATAAGALSTAGFVAASGGNATRTATTTISYAPGDDARATLLAGQVPGAVLSVDATQAAGTLSLVLGSDFTGVGQAITPPTPTTSADAYANVQRTADDTSCID